MLTMSERNETTVPWWRLVLRRAVRPERFGQFLASLCWIASMLVYGIESAGDWLQLCAASAWFAANVAAVLVNEKV